MKIRSIDENNYIPLRMVVKNEGEDPVFVSLHSSGNDYEIHFPDEMESLIDNVISEKVELDNAYVQFMKTDVKIKINAKIKEMHSAGFVANFSSGATAKLQISSEEDRINWLGSQSLYSQAVMAGRGDEIGATFRDANNANHIVSFEEGNNILISMGTYVASILHNSWALKDSLEVASTRAEIDAVIATIDTGWPT